MAIIAFWIIGLVVTVLALARMVNYLFEKRFSFAFHAVVGIVVASTLVIIPVTYRGKVEILLSVVCFVVGVVAAWLLSKLEGRKDEAQKDMEAAQAAEEGKDGQA